MFSALRYKSAEHLLILRAVIVLDQISSCNILRVIKKRRALALLILRKKTIGFIQPSAVQSPVLLLQIGQLQPVFSYLYLFTQQIHAIVNTVKVYVYVF